MTGTNSRPIPKIPNLADVLLTSLANGDFLAWDSGSSKWINTVHGTSGDPHTQYLKTDGSRALTGNQSAGSNKITNLGTPSASTDAATKGYVDSVAQGLDVKLSVRVATTANGTLSTAFANGQTVDGVTLATGDRILLKDQSTASQNGIYIVAASGSPSRAADLAASSSAAGAFCFVEEGTANADKGFVCTSNVGSDVVGTNNLTWTQFTGAAGGVTSVDLSAPAIFSVSGNPITSSGTLALSLATQTANYIWAGPTTGSAAAPTFRAMVAADLPVMTGDSGSGGTKGAVPAPSAGDAAAGKFLKADGTWEAPSGSGGGSNWLAPVICSTTANVSISGGGIANGTTHDGITVSTGQRILVQFQSTASENGVYIVPASGAASRASDMAAGVTCDSYMVPVSRGTLYSDLVFNQTANGCVVGTNNQTWQTMPRTFTGDSGSGGSSGSVPAPAAGDAAAGKFLKADATWATPSAGSSVPGATSNNLLHNSGFAVGQRADFSSAVSCGDDNYGLDRWNCLSEYLVEAIQRATGTNARYACYVKNNAGSSKRVGISQILEANDSIQLRGRAVTFKTRLKCDQTKNLRIAILEWTGTADSVTSDVVNNWSSGTFTAGNFFNSTTLTVSGTQQVACTAATWTTGTLTVTLGSSVNNVIVMVFTEDQLSDANGFYLECPQLNDGSTAGDWIPRPYAEELLICQRYCYGVTGERFHGVLLDTANIVGTYVRTPVPMRATPTMSVQGSPTWNAGAPGSTQVAAYGLGATTGYASISGSITVNAYSYDPWTFIIWYVAGTNFAGGGGTVGSHYQMLTGSSVRVLLESEL